MADSSARLPIFQKMTKDQVVCLRHWHRTQIDNLTKFAEGHRDEKSIKRSMQIVQDCNTLLTSGSFVAEAA